jgi:hypothetical protein
MGKIVYGKKFRNRKDAIDYAKKIRLNQRLAGENSWAKNTKTKKIDSKTWEVEWYGTSENAFIKMKRMM